jgi:hypothetical protein
MLGRLNDVLGEKFPRDEDEPEETLPQRGKFLRISHQVPSESVEHFAPERGCPGCVIICSSKKCVVEDAGEHFAIRLLNDLIWGTNKIPCAAVIFCVSFIA